MANDHSHRALSFLFLATLVDSIGFSIIFPVLPKLLMELGGVDVAASAQWAGLLIGVFALLQFFFAPVIGNLSDRFGRRPVLLSCLFAFGVNYGVMGLAPSIRWLFVGRVLTGVAGAINAPASAFIADVTPPEKRAHAFSLLGASFSAGLLLGPVLGGWAAEFGTRAPFFVAAGLALLNFVYGLSVLPETLPAARRRPFTLARATPFGTFRTLRSLPGIAKLAFAVWLWQLAVQVYPSTWAFYTLARFNLSSTETGLTLALSAISLMLVQSLLTGRIVRRLGERRAAPIGMLTAVFVFAAYALIPRSWMLYPLLVLGGLQGVSMPAINAMLSRRIGPGRQGELQGAMASVVALAAVVGPLSMTQIMAFFCRTDSPVQLPGAAFLLAASLSMLGLCVLLSQAPRGAPPHDAAARVPS